MLAQLQYQQTAEDVFSAEMLNKERTQLSLYGTSDQ